jgi:hypothetical protein
MTDKIGLADTCMAYPSDMLGRCGAPTVEYHRCAAHVDIPGPGKFEACDSLKLAEYLYGLTGESGLDDEMGEVDGLGWYGLYLYDGSDAGEAAGATDCYILAEDSQGFFTYETFDSGTDTDPRIASMDAMAEWHRLERHACRPSRRHERGARLAHSLEGVLA